MARVEVVRLQVHSSDCDPLGTAQHTSYFRWYDAASRIYFERCGLPPWRDLNETRGIIGTPLLEVASRFFAPLLPSDHFEIHTSIVRWEPKVFTQRHIVYRDGTCHAEGEEKRVFACRDPDTGRVRALTIPADILASCQ
jgi:4-hydroxybenzoyl-CoA thioesterase